MQSALVLVLILLAGCSSIEKHPISVECSGKGQITGTGAVGPGGVNAFTLQADCGDGFTFKSGPK